MSSKPLIVSTIGLLGLGLCSSAPPPEGVETRFMVGSGAFDYKSGGCGGPTRQRLCHGELSAFDGTDRVRGSLRRTGSYAW